MIERRVAAALVLPAVTALASFGYYGFRGGLVPWLLDEGGAPYSRVAELLTTMLVARAIGVLSGGVGAALTGPHVAAAAALAVAAVGVLGCAALPEPWLVAALTLAAAGSGAAVPGVWAGAASVFARPLGAGRDALFFVLYASIQTGAFLGAMGAGFAFGSDASAILRFGPFAAALLIGAVLAGGLGAAHLALPPVPEDSPTERLEGGAAGLALVVGALALLPWLGWSTLLDASSSIAYTTGLSLPPWVDYANPFLVGVTTLVGALALAGLGWAGFDPPTLLAVGAGFLACAVAGGLGAAGASTGSVVTPVAALLILSGAEGFVVPLLLSRLLGDLHWRVAGLVAGFWFGGTSLLTLAANPVVTLAGSLAPWWPMAAGAALCSLGGLVLLAVAIPHHRLLAVVLDGPAPEHAD